MRAGRLRHRIDIRQPSTERDTYGEPVVTWSTLDTVWASVEPMNGKEVFKAGQILDLIPTKIVIRYRDDMTTKMRVRWVKDATTRYFKIHHILNPMERDKEMTLVCVETTEELSD